MKRCEFNILLGALAFAALLGLANSAIAEYPERPVTIIVPFAAGGLLTLWHVFLPIG